MEKEGGGVRGWEVGKMIFFWGHGLDLCWDVGGDRGGGEG